MDFKKTELNRLQEENSLLKLKIKEKDEIIASLNKQVDDYKAKEESISNAIVFAVERSNQLEDSRKRLYQLDIQRSRLLYMRMEQVLNELYLRYPELKKEPKLIDMSEKFKQALFSHDISNYDSTVLQSNVKEDPIRKLLNNIINYIDDEKQPRTIKRNTTTQINIPSPETYTSQPSYANTPSSSGFDINEALHPSQSLEEILKAFDLGKSTK